MTKLSINVQILKLRQLTSVVAGLMLAACGGGGAQGTDSALSSIAAPGAVTTAAKSFTPTTSTPVTVLTPVTTPGANPAPATIGAVITDIKVQNTGGAQTAVPFTFGQIFAVGHLQPGDGLAAKLADGTILALQIDVKATHADGSVRHAVISGVLPALAAGETRVLQLAKSNAVASASALTPQNLVDAGLSGSINIKVDNVQYSASLAGALASATPIKWLAGSTANEWIVSAPLKTSSGAVHPHLTARFDVRWYSGLNKQARVEFVVENNKTFAAGSQNFIYDVNLELGGKTVYSQTNLTHYHHARWHSMAWWNTTPEIHLKHNTAYLIASKAVSNYDQSIVPSETELASYSKQVSAATTGPMKLGPLLAYMPATGGRGDIGPLPVWSVMYLLSMDKRAKDMMMSAAEASGSWSVHYRDEKTDYPIRIDNEINKRISTHWNLRETGPLPVPRCGANTEALCGTPYADDTAHQPSLAYLPYLVTGDYYYLEELHFWASSNPLGTEPNSSGMGLGLVRWQQVRAQAWSMRTLGHAAYITPDTHALKAYFNKQLDNNLDFYQSTYVTGNPNQLGVYDGSGEYSYEVKNSAPWQDDFFTWSFGYLTELGFAKAEPIFRWKAKFPVGRMTGPGYCWIEGSAYGLEFRDKNGVKFKNFAELYTGNFTNEWITDDNGRQIFHPLGLKYLDQPCGSQAQADWRTVAQGFSWPWEKGQMIGYSTSAMGYPSNMQPALAVIGSSGVPNGALAWSIFAGRAGKPNYSDAPQWAIVPR